MFTHKSVIIRKTCHASEWKKKKRRSYFYHGLCCLLSAHTLFLYRLLILILEWFDITRKKLFAQLFWNVSGAFIQKSPNLMQYVYVMRVFLCLFLFSMCFFQHVSALRTSCLYFFFGVKEKTRYKRNLEYHTHTNARIIQINT